MARIFVVVAAVLVLLAPLSAKDLEIYFVDVEGGQATLIVSPSGKSMLVDAGWPGANGRDADRIVEAAKAAGLKQIDLMLMTHHHVDHVGGIPPLAAKFPIGAYLDHGPNNETDANAKKLSAAYEETIKNAKHIVLKPGDKIPLEGVDVDVVMSNGEAIAKALPGAGQPNAACAGVAPKENDPTENARSIAFVLRHGKFRFADFGDITWNKELALACPNNLVGRASVYLTTHHGIDISNSPAIIGGLQPRVAIMNNGARKGGAPAVFQILRKTPGFEDLWQLHYSVPAAKENDAAGQLIANPETPCQGKWIKLTASSDGSFTVVNSRNGFTKKYAK
jgi:competence protein ComEC